MRMRSNSMRMRSKSSKSSKPSKRIKKTRKGGANTYETIKSLSYTRSAKRDLSGPYNKMVRKKTPLLKEPSPLVQEPLVQQQQSPMKKKHFAMTANKVKGMVANIEQFKSNNNVNEKLPAPRKKIRLV
jgi:hypothetical protein